LCSLPANVIERGLVDSTGELPIILAKSLDFSWETTMALLFLGAPGFKISAQRLDSLSARFSRLTVQTAQSVVKLYRNQHELSHGRRSAGAFVADRHPVLAQRLDGRWNAEVGIGELAGLTIPGLRAEQRTALIVATVYQDGPQSTVVEIAGVQQRRPTPIT